ncbi:RHS repeat-associated core domain-containing protein [Neolewinella aurantiaca]|uniref:RHS repeat-associated core domain-containing protein n=1 Tax=Neolewinella aurantiaca TaxID=2602767 RepID=UPI001650256D|nr:RHS repeat-associated core domain-containing protein [Neolewinella aurantiaca]
MKPLRPFIITGLTFRADGADAIQIDYAADYYPYGKILREYKACNQNRYLSTHHERDKDTGYDNRGARLYDSEIGRFLGVDPLADHPNQIMMSPYQYVWGNPVSLTDPDGECPWCLGALVGGGVEIISQMTTNLATGKPILDIDYYDVAQSTITGALTGGISTLTATVKVARIAKVALVVTDELAKASTDVTFSDGEIKVESLANGSKAASDVAVEASISLLTGKVSDAAGAKLGDAVNAGLRSTARSAANKIKKFRPGSNNHTQAVAREGKIQGLQSANAETMTSATGIFADTMKEPVTNKAKAMFNQAIGKDEK